MQIEDISSKKKHGIFTDKHNGKSCASFDVEIQRTAPVINRWLRTACAIGLFRKSGLSIAWTPLRTISWITWLCSCWIGIVYTWISNKTYLWWTNDASRKSTNYYMLFNHILFYDNTLKKLFMVENIVCITWENEKKLRKFWGKNNKQNSFYEKIVTPELIFHEINFEIIILPKNKIWSSSYYLGFETL